ASLARDRAAVKGRGERGHGIAARRCRMRGKREPGWGGLLWGWGRQAWGAPLTLTAGPGRSTFRSDPQASKGVEESAGHPGDDRGARLDADDRLLQPVAGRGHHPLVA